MSLSVQMELSPLFVTRRPHGPLAGFVDMIWLWRSKRAAHRLDQVLPDGNAGLIINLADDEIRVYEAESHALIHHLEGSGFTGACAHPYVIDTDEQIFVAGVQFLPGGAWPFMRNAQDEVSGAHFALRDIWGFDVASLREQLLRQPTPHRVLGLLAQTLVDHLHRPLEHHRAVQIALRSIQRDPAGARIGRISAECGISSRRLSRLFELEVGMTPKLYARLVRFRQVLAASHASPEADWSDVALACGYFDQAHLIRDFKSFSGFTPTQYRALTDDPSSHVRIA